MKTNDLRAMSRATGRACAPAGKTLHSRAGALLLACAVLIAGGCASVNPRDPFESYNRSMYNFNDRVDQYVLKPVAEGYRAVVPQVLRNGIRNFFANIEDVWIGANNLMQLKIGEGLSDWMRVVLNTTFGLGGIYDVASEAGLEKHNEDFGQTLGWWGVPSGPYLVLPVLGPSTVRDAPAFVVDASLSSYGVVANAASPDNATNLRLGLVTLNLLNKRAEALGATTIIDQAALDRYAFTRDAFLQRRRNQVYDGDPPREKDPDEDAALHRAPVAGTPGDAARVEASRVENETAVHASNESPDQVSGQPSAAEVHVQGSEGDAAPGAQSER